MSALTTLEMDLDCDHKESIKKFTRQSLSKSISKVVKADIYPEFGTYPGGGESPIIPFGNEKNAEREIIHGRWAQLGVTGAWAAENGTGIPWFTAGTLCTPDDCTAVADKFPGAVAPLAPEGSGYPSFWNVLIIETVLVGAAEAYRTGLAANPFDDGLVAGDVSPGGRFDPLGLAESGDLEELKIKELKHCRLSMFAWLGCIMQALATQEGPIANWTAHTADPSKSISKVVKADIYPEFGTYPGGGESPIIPFGDEKNAEREIIHGRWAQLGVTGAWAAENGTGIPWFTAGTLCTPDDCTAVADKFPGAVAPLAPEGSGYPSFWNVLIIETVLVGAAEAYRTGLAANPFDDGLVAGDVSPGGRFDPLGLAESGDLEELKIKELKHCRLSMFAWLGCIFQALATQEGPIANWTAHTADPVHANVLTNAAKGFGFY
ncbi:unnamed protein product [Bathycoccus prasinos]